MKRRSLLQSLALAPAAAAVPASAQSSPAASPPLEGSFALSVTGAEGAGTALQGYFTAEQFSALRRLAQIAVPAFGNLPGAIEAAAPEFLALYVSRSSPETQKLYRDGLDRLNSESQRSHSKLFADISAEEAGPLLKPLTAAWTYAGPSGVLARFLVTAKDDLLRATWNSRAYAVAREGSSRNAPGSSYYWLAVE